MKYEFKGTVTQKTSLSEGVEVTVQYAAGWDTKEFSWLVHRDRAKLFELDTSVTITLEVTQ